MGKREAELKQVRFLLLASIRPSPENDKIYHPVNPNDPDIVALAESIEEHGVKEPLVITSDGWIISGHRRYAASKMAGLKEVPCLVEDISREDDPDAFLVALREHNRQREKSFDEKVRESVVTMNPDEAYMSLIEERKLRSRVKAPVMELREAKVRAAITKAKIPFLNAVVKVLKEFEEYWPVSQRFIHYKLLNDPPLTHASKPNSHYRNDRRSSAMLSGLVTRARIEGLIPEDAIEDDTRPVTIWDCHGESGAFIESCINGFLKGYSRDLMQSQPCHIELMVEKNTVAGIVRQVAMDYCIPMTSGHGFCSLPPRIAMKNRFLASGKERLLIIVLTDFDADGEVIAESFVRYMRDDFHITNISAVRAGLTLEQVTKFHFQSSIESKKKSRNYPLFKKKYGAKQKPYELEAVPPELLQSELRRVIDSVIDRKLFNAELSREKDDAVKLEALRLSAKAAMKNFGGNGK